MDTNANVGKNKATAATTSPPQPLSPGPGFGGNGSDRSEGPAKAPGQPAAALPSERDGEKTGVRRVHHQRAVGAHGGSLLRIIRSR